MSDPKQVPCARCGEMVTVYITRKRRRYHPECAIAVQRDYISQMRAKSGPYYDAWLTAMGPIGRQEGMTTSPSGT